GNLPSDLPAPRIYSKDNPSEQPILYMMLTSDTMTSGPLYDYGNKTIGQRISMIGGVSKVQVWGAKTAVRIQVSPDKLAALQIGLDEVAQVLKNGTVTIPGGSLNGAYRTFAIEPKGQLLKADDYNKLIIAYRNGAPVRLKDVAKCIDSLNNNLVNVMYGKAGGNMRGGSVCIAISRQSGANTVALSKRIKQTIEQIKKEIPGSVNLNVFYDKSIQIVSSVNDVKTTILIALVLVVCVIFLFLGRIKETIIPAITLPISIISTFVIMAAAGFSLDNLSLMALTLSVGFLVDDAIVVLENTVRHVEEGINPFAAAVKSMKEITGTVISTSVALVVVFVPLIFMGGVVGRNFREFALTVVFAIVCSTLLALSLTPMMCARLLKATGTNKTTIQKMIDVFVGGMTRKYGVLLKWVLHHKYISVLLWIGCIGGTLWLFGILPKTFMPEGDSGAVYGQLVAPQGMSTEQMRKFQCAVNNVLLSDPNIDQAFTLTGAGGGADQSTGPFFATLKPIKERMNKMTMQQVVGSLNMKMAAIPYGITFVVAIPALSLSAGGESTAAGSKYSYTIKGDDRNSVYKYAGKIEEKMRTLKGFVGIQTSVKLDMPKLDVNIFRDRASTLGISAKDIEYALSLAYAGGKVTTYLTDIDQYDVILELDDNSRKKPSNLSKIYLRSSSTNELIPIATVADWNETVGPKNVPHNDQMNSATISFSLESDMPIGDATKALESAAIEILPPEISGTFQGEAQEFQEAVQSMAVLLVVAVFLMYIILGILYESYIHPFTVLTTLPVAVFGGLATLFFFKSELSLYAYIGMFMLLGIVAKNGIMMVDFATQYIEEENASGFDAIYQACIVRFRPILMTGASTIMGALPIALGFGADGASRIPLGLIIVGGLAFAQVITLFVTPGIFLYMDNLQKKVFKTSEEKDLAASGNPETTRG
ncbi:MAG: efflux RND transporter permease subunit, partial [Candidatus Theseobacter exili]|nr:efflux RND transporter permease subunit [Candidatus Theseobacter exili]